MDIPVRSASYESTVKCSTCAANVELSALADHVCATATPITDTNLTTEPAQLSEAQVYHPPKRGASLFRRERPTLPKLDSSMSVRSGLDPREAASIAHDLGLPSPVSAGSGRRSPRPSSSRKTSRSRVTHGPRSPELPVSQDCAFPPFPLSKPKRAQTDKDITYAKPRTTSRSTSRAPSRAKTYQTSIVHSTSSSIQSSGSSDILKRVISQTSSTQRSRQGTLDDNTSTQSTSPSSPILSATGNNSSSRGSAETLLSLPPLEPSSNNGTPDISNSVSPATPLDHLPGRVSPSRIVKSPFSKSYQRSMTEKQREPPSENEIVGVGEGRTDSAVTFDHILPSERVQITSEKIREPAYKSKRPPALVQPQVFLATNQEGPQSARLPTALLAGGIGRTITNFFGRKRSQSVSSKKMSKPDFDSPRMRALAPEIPEVPKRMDGEFGVPGDSYFPIVAAGSLVILNTELDRAEQKAERNSFKEVPIQSPQASRSDTPPHNSLTQQAHEETVSQVDQAGEEHFDFSFSKEEDSTNTTATRSVDIEQDLDGEPTEIFPTEVTTQEDDVRRVSIDSASSYGSVGFSNRTTSSRSSLPPSEESRNKLSLASESDYTTTISMDHIAPLNPHVNDIVPDSPTDAICQPGSLSPIFETPSSGLPEAAERPASLEKPHRAPSRLDSLQPRVVTSAASSRPSTPAGTKGICRGCSQMIMAGQKSVSSKDGRLTGRYHKDCFACRTCKNPFATADFYVHNDEPYCSHDYHVINNTLCGACGKGIEGQYMETFDANGGESKKFHSKCLTCSTCRTQLGDDYFEYHGRVYCERDAFRAANGPKSPYDNAPSRPSPLVREYINSSEPGLKGRFPERRTTRLMMI